MAIKRIAVVEHEAGVSAGHFESWLRARALPFELIPLHRGDRIPDTVADVAGICSLGGNMSVNDSLPWIADEIRWIRAAVEQSVPVIGHCLGGQLLAVALGARVVRNPCKEMGWWPVQVDDPQLANEWLGSVQPVELFHWHGDAFELPAGARPFLSSYLTTHQAYVAERHGVEHLGMQFHVEMTPELVNAWVSDDGVAEEVEEERARTGGAGVQSPAEMKRDVEVRAARMKALAWRLYDRWARGLSR